MMLKHTMPLLLTAAISLISIANAVEPLRIVATGGRMGTDTYTVSGSVTAFRHRTPHKLGGPVDEIQVGFMNWRYYYDTEISNTNDTTISYAWLERESTGQIVPLTFDSNRQFVMPADATNSYFSTDAVDSSVWTNGAPTQDDVFWVNVIGSLPTNGSICLGSPATWTGAKFVVYDSTNTAYQSHNVADTNGALPWVSGQLTRSAGMPLVFMGRYSEPGHLSVIGTGDSILYGSGDTVSVLPCIAGFGFFDRAAVDESGENTIAVFNMARHGATSQIWGSSVHMPGLLKLANVLVEEFGTNDIGSNGTGDTNSLITRLEGIWSLAESNGVQHILRTQLLPRTTSTNNWATFDGQTPNTGWGDGEKRDAMNSYFQSALSNGTIDVVVNTLDPVSDPADDHYWLSNGTNNYVTGDGTHLNVMGNAILAPVLRAELLAFDAAPPATPANLTAIAVSASQIDLSWSAAAEASSYIVKRGITNGVYTTTISNVTETSYSDTGLTAATPYYYVVSAVNINGESADSAEASATTIDPYAPPETPTNLTATAVTTNQINLSWSAIAYTDSYIVKRGITNGVYTTIISNVFSTSYPDTGLDPATPYYYVVSAVNTNGESANSAEASATTPAAPASQADVLMLNFGLTITAASNSPYHAEYSVFTGTNWTQVTDNMTNGIVWSDGSSATNITIALGDSTAAGSTVVDLSSSYNTSDLGGTLYEGIYSEAARSGIFTDSSNPRYVGAQISGLAAGTYDVYMTTRNTSTAGAHTQHLVAGASSGTGNFDVASYDSLELAYATVSPSSEHGLGYTWTPEGSAGENYAKFTVVVNDGESLNIASIGVSGENRGFLNSAQIARTSSETPAPAPNAPADLTATAVSASQIDLSWSASAGADSYIVKRGITNGVYTTSISNIYSTSYSDTNLSAATPYYYVVSAVNTNGESANSAEASATTIDPFAPPEAPTNLTATAISTNQIDLSWSAVADADSYIVKRGTASEFYTTIISNVFSTSYPDTGLDPATPYYYVVSAVSTNGESANSAQATATTLSASTSTVAVLMLDFGSTTSSGDSLTNSPYHSVNNAFTDTSWNVLTSDASTGLVWSDGASASGITVDVGRTLVFGSTVLLLDQSVSTTTGSALTTGIYDGPGSDGIFATAANAGNARYAGAQISGLSAGDYTVYVSGRNGNTTGSGAQQFFAGTSTNGNFDVAGYDNQIVTNAAASPTFWDGYYASFTISLSEGDSLNIASIGTVSELRGFLNTLQIVPASTTPPAPTPASLSFVYSNGVFSVSSADLTGSATHTLQMKTNLTDVVWSDLAVTSGVTSASWMITPDSGHAFFRIKSE